MVFKQKRTYLNFENNIFRHKKILKLNELKSYKIILKLLNEFQCSDLELINDLEVTTDPKLILINNLILNEINNK